jgi:UPF0755 protein
VQAENRNRVAVFFVGFFAALLLILVFLTYCLHKKSTYVPERNFILEHLDDDAFSRLLIDKNISSNVVVTKVLIKVTKLLGYRAKFGEYVLPGGVSLFEAIKIVDSGRVVIHKFTIPEGFSVFQFLKKLNKDENLLGEVTQIPEEGSILPDTYCFKYPTKKQEIITMAQKAMKSFIQKEWPRRSEKCPLKTPEEALTLASIVQKETNIEKEMIAGIYLRRLKIKMKLQACPTAIYAHKRGDTLGHALKYSELTIDDPYNTYVYEGLPPTPISNPARDSIIAVLHPVETDNLFFVYEGKGRHAFAKTYTEHKRNIARVRDLNVADVR